MQNRRAGVRELYHALAGGDFLIVRAGFSEPLLITPFRLAVEIAKVAEAKNSRKAEIAPAHSGITVRNIEMSNDEQEPRNLPIRTDDGFEDSGDSDRLLQGVRAACVDGDWSTLHDEAKIPLDERFLALATAEGLQHWQDGELIEEIIKKPDKPLPDVDELNAKIPEETWVEGRNGPRPPWSHQYAVYLLKMSDGSIYTHINSTAGAAIATRELKSRVKWKRAMLGGRKVVPIVTLGKQLVSRQYKKWGPSFIIVDWRDLDPALPEQAAAPQLEDRTEKEPLNDPVADIGRPVTEPSMAEYLDDKIPEDNWQPPGEPAAKAAPEAPAPRKPAAQKPQMTKKGVQKIASGRQ